jgi:hypothetical protein
MFGSIGCVRRGFVARSFVNSIDSARELFFSPDLPREDLVRYHKQLAACSPVRLIDLADVNKQVRAIECGKVYTVHVHLCDHYT